MDKVTRYQDLLNADHAALVAECERIDRALAKGVDPYAQTEELPAVKRNVFGVWWYDNPYAVATR
jgi:hypothetical protein